MGEVGTRILESERKTCGRGEPDLVTVLRSADVSSVPTSSCNVIMATPDFEWSAGTHRLKHFENVIQFMSNLQIMTSFLTRLQRLISYSMQ